MLLSTHREPLIGREVFTFNTMIIWLTKHQHTPSEGYVADSTATRQCSNWATLVCGANIVTVEPVRFNRGSLEERGIDLQRGKRR